MKRAWNMPQVWRQTGTSPIETMPNMGQNMLEVGINDHFANVCLANANHHNDGRFNASFHSQQPDPQPNTQ